MQIIRFGFSLVLIMLLSCNAPEQIPAYVRLEPFVVNAPGGTAWQEITEGWLYVDGEFLGAYPLPGTVPVLNEGAVEVYVLPGIKENGIAATPNFYPFLSRYDQKITLTPGQTVTLKPVTNYPSDVVYPFPVERTTFDSDVHLNFEDRDADRNTSVSLTANGAFAGRCLIAELSAAHPSIRVASEAVKLPTTQEREVWLEIHYRADTPFGLSILGESRGTGESGVPVFQFNRSTNWNKVYINLTEFLIGLQKEQYRLFFAFELPRDANGALTQNTGTVRVDNLKLLHF